MLMIRQKTEGVSPVIGVILMVAITVIIAAVVANFVLGLAGNLEQEADATVTFNQEVSDFSNQYYNVSVTVSQLDNADYVVVKAQNESGPGTDSGKVDESYAGPKPSDSDITDAPGSAADSGSVTSNGGILISAGDQAVVQDLAAGQTVQVFGGLDGSENLITTYTVEDTL